MSNKNKETVTKVEEAKLLEEAKAKEEAEAKAQREAEEERERIRKEERAKVQAEERAKREKVESELEVKSSKSVTIKSMATCDIVFPVYTKLAEGVISSPNTFGKVIIIKGGANVCNSYGQTPKFVETTLSAEEYDLIKDKSGFKRKVANGFFVIDSDIKTLKADKSAQISEDDMKKKHPDVTASVGKVDA